MTVTAQLSAVSSLLVTLPFTVTGTASSPADYTITASPITIAAGATIGSATITVVNDTLYENNETVVLTMGTPTNASKGTTTVHTATITDDDPSPSVQWSAASQSGAEDVGTMTVTAQLSAVSGLLVQVPFTMGGTATLDDYSIPASLITIAAGAITGSTMIIVTGDNLVESDETVVLTLGIPINATAGTITEHTATITNDDTSVSVAVLPASVMEDGSTNLVYTFTRAGVTAGSLTSNFSVDGTATFGTDYTQSGATNFSFSNGTVTFGDGETTKDVTLDPTPDATVEPNATAILTVTSGTGYTPGTQSMASGTITNDDYTVTFDAQGGTTPNPTSKSVTYGSSKKGLSLCRKKPLTVAKTWVGCGHETSPLDHYAEIGGA